MTEKELKKLNRYQLLDILVMQMERADKLQKKVEELEAQLEERDLNFYKLGSVAEIAAKISGVLEAAQQAADLYLDAAKKQASEILAHANDQTMHTNVRAEVKVPCGLGEQQDGCNSAAEKRSANDEEI